MPPPERNDPKPTFGTQSQKDRAPATPQDANQEPAAALVGDAKAPEVKSPVASPQAAPAAPQEPGKKLDETAPGGRYEVGGKIVDADGKPIAKK